MNFLVDASLVLLGVGCILVMAVVIIDAYENKGET